MEGRVSPDTRANLALARELLDFVPEQVTPPHNDDQADGLPNAAPPAFVCRHCGHAMTIVQSFMRGQAIRALNRPGF